MQEEVEQIKQIKQRNCNAGTNEKIVEDGETGARRKYDPEVVDKEEEEKEKKIN